MCDLFDMFIIQDSARIGHLNIMGIDVPFMYGRLQQYGYDVSNSRLNKYRVVIEAIIG